ncbi:P-loop containing nucleoside triphosphate hydrolase protein, partial [Trichophaea hybrida]
MTPIAERNDDGILIGVMGVTGCGKSYFCRVTTGDDTIQVSNGLDSCTKHAQKHHFELDGKIVTLVDTPGFDDSNHGDGYVLRNIADMLRECYQGGGKKFSAIIYLHRISDIRMGGAARKNLRLFRELCGCDSGSLENVLLATNRWDLVTESDGRQREERLQSHPDCWKSLMDSGSTVVRFDGTRQSALTLIRSVIRNTPQPLQIQMEMVDQHKCVNDTAAGRFVNEEIEKLRQYHEKELAELRAEMEQVKEEDEERRRLLKEDYDR